MMVLVEITPKPHANGVNGVNGMKPALESAALHRDLNRRFLAVERAEGNYKYLEDGSRFFDASGGPSVGCIGWGNERVARAVYDQMRTSPYSGSVFHTTKVHEDLCRDLVDSTGGEMSRAYIVNSGS